MSPLVLSGSNGDSTAGANTSQNVARRWAQGAFRSRLKKIAVAFVFTGLGPLIAILAVGVINSMVPSEVHEFGSSKVRVENIAHDVIVPYVDLGGSALGGAESTLESASSVSAYCDSTAQIQGVTTRIRSVLGASAMSSVNLSSGELKPYEVALSPRLLALLRVTPGDRLNVAAGGITREFTVSETEPINPNQTDSLLAVVSIRAQSPVAERCVALLPNDEAASRIRTALARELGEASVDTMPSEGQHVDEYMSVTEMRLIWLVGTVLAIGASSAVASAYWGLMLPGLFKDSLSLVAMGVLPRHIKAEISKLVAFVGSLGLLAGVGTGLLLVRFLTGTIARAASVSAPQPPVGAVLVILTTLIGSLGLAVQIVKFARPLASYNLFGAKNLTFLERPSRKRALIGIVMIPVGGLFSLLVDGVFGLVLGIGCFSVALRQLHIYFADKSSRYYVKNFARAIRPLSPATSLAWLAVGVFGFISVFATVETARSYPDVPDSVLIASQEWGWGTDLKVPTRFALSQADDFLEDEKLESVVVAQQIGNGNQADAVVGASEAMSVMPAYLAAPELLSILEIEAPDGAKIFTTSNADFRLLGDTRLMGLDIAVVSGAHSRVGPSLFITPETVEHFDLETVDAALVVKSDRDTLGWVSEILESRGITTVYARHYSLSGVISVACLLVSAFAVYFVCLAHRGGIVIALAEQARSLYALGMTSKQVNSGTRLTSAYSAIAAAPILGFIVILPVLLLRRLANVSGLTPLVVAALIISTMILAVTFTSPKLIQS